MTPQRAVRRAIFSVNSCMVPSPRRAGGSLHVSEVFQTLADLGLLVVGESGVRRRGVRVLGWGLRGLGRALSHGSLSSRTWSRTPPGARAGRLRGAPGSG